MIITVKNNTELLQQIAIFTLKTTKTQLHKAKIHERATIAVTLIRDANAKLQKKKKKMES